MGLMLLWANDFRAVFWVAVIPAALCIVVLVWGVKEPERPSSQPRTNPICRENLRRLSQKYWWVVPLGAVFTLARFSEAFLVLRLQQGGLPLALTPLALVLMSLVFSLGAYPLGKLSDRMSHTTLLAWGLVVLIAADALLAWRGHGIAAWLGIALWGLHMAMTQGLLATMVAVSAPADLRGTAFGMFNLASGVALLVASALAGLLWDQWGASATFLAGGVFSTLALLGVLWHARTEATPPKPPLTQG
jgi:predicted MFS family arabinose efflux permease